MIEKIIEKGRLTEHKVLLIKLDGFTIDRNLGGLIAN